MKIKKVLLKQKQAVHKIGKSKLLTIPAQYAPNKKKVEVVIGQTEKGNNIMIVKLS